MAQAKLTLGGYGPGKLKLLSILGLSLGDDARPMLEDTVEAKRKKETIGTNNDNWDPLMDMVMEIKNISSINSRRERSYPKMRNVWRMIP